MKTASYWRIVLCAVLALLGVVAVFVWLSTMNVRADEAGALLPRTQVTIPSSSSSPSRLSVELVGQIGGPMHAIAAQGNYAYAGVGPRLVILNVSDPAHPVVAGQSEVLPGLVEGVAVSGDYAYVADGDAGLYIINISNPFSPTQAGLFSTSGPANRVVISSCWLEWTAHRQRVRPGSSLGNWFLRLRLCN
jgi:hypothetical protein